MPLPALIPALLLLAAQPAGAAGVGLAPGAPAGTAPAGDPKAALADALAACEAWVLQPASWSGNIPGFPAKAGLEGRLEPRHSMQVMLLPPEALRRNLHFWFEGAGPGAGVFLTTSDTLPMCHIAAGGPVDLQPAAAALVASPAFLAHWQKVDRKGLGEMLTERYTNVADPKFEIVISRAAQPGGRTDHVQVLATAHYKSGNE